MSNEGKDGTMNHAEQAKEILCAYLVDSTRRKETEDIGRAVDCIIAAAVEAMKAELRKEETDAT